MTMHAEHDLDTPAYDERELDELSPAEQAKYATALDEAMREVAHADLAYPVDDCAICRSKVW